MRSRACASWTKGRSCSACLAAATGISAGWSRGDRRRVKTQRIDLLPGHADRDDRRAQRPLPRTGSARRAGSRGHSGAAVRRLRYFDARPCARRRPAGGRRRRGFPRGRGRRGRARRPARLRRLAAPSNRRDVSLLVLFDVDGTLLLTHDEVYVEANRIALTEVYGDAPEGPDVPGDTATAHNRRALTDAGFSTEQIDAGLGRWCETFAAQYV